VVDWIAYGSAVQTAKDRSQFGSGDIRGVIAPESSNNAKEGGGLVPTLIFGIPGSGSMAIFLGGLALLNMMPGPQMVRNNLDITYTIVWSLALANVFGAGLCILLSGWIARLTRIRFTILAPYLFMIIAFAAFQSRQTIGDLVALLGIGFIGILLRRFDFSRPAFLIGFVLSGQAERFANQAHQIATARFRRSFEAGIDYLFSPITIVLLILTIISIIIGIRASKNIRESTEAPTSGRLAPAAFLVCITAYVLVAWIDAYSITRVSDKIFPLTIGAVTLLGCFALLFRMVLAPETDDVFIDLEKGGDGVPSYGLWSTLAWFAGLLVLTGIFGLIIALAIFLIAFFRLRGGFTPLISSMATSIGIAFMVSLAGVLGRDFPPGLLQRYFDLPWPFT
jgi:putative tricarboxylic transport membrane protein